MGTQQNLFHSKSCVCFLLPLLELYAKQRIPVFNGNKVNMNNFNHINIIDLAE